MICTYFSHVGFTSTGEVEHVEGESGVGAGSEDGQTQGTFPSSHELYHGVDLIGGRVGAQSDLGKVLIARASHDERQDPIRTVHRRLGTQDQLLFDVRQTLRQTVLPSVVMNFFLKKQ